MPLLVKNAGADKVFEKSFDELSNQYPRFTTEAKNFHRQQKKNVSPNGLVYVGQKEMAVTNLDDQNVKFLGSEDATTCHIVILQVSGAVALSHLDGSGTEEAIRKMISELKHVASDPCTSITAHVYGGFMDSRGLSLRLSREIITAFQSYPEKIYLETACMTHMNSCVRDGINYPVVYGVAVNIATGEIFPAEFPDKGPDRLLRNVRHSVKDDVLSIYNSGCGEIIIPPFDYEPFPDAEVWLSAPPSVILKYLSTSPQQEPSDFVDIVKETIRFTLATSNEAVFPGGRSRRHRIMPGGIWQIQS